MSTAVFPTLKGIMFPLTRTPIFSTLVQESAAGTEARARLQTSPRWKWLMSFDWLRTDNNDWQTLLSFYLARSGQYDSFLLNDPDDFTVTTQTIAVSDGSTLIYQLVRSLNGYTEPVYAPHVVSAVYNNGTPMTVVTDYGIGNWENGSNPNGSLVFASGHQPAAGHTITADFTYYWPVRFAADSYDFAKFMDKRYQVDKLELLSVKNSS